MASGEMGAHPSRARHDEVGRHSRFGGLALSNENPGMKAGGARLAHSSQMSHREFNLTVGKLPPVFNDSRVSSLWKLIEDFAGFQAGGFNR
jgi:hypothetical protein